jgi:DNA-binding transcriptional LysR family regulator
MFFMNDLVNLTNLKYFCDAVRLGGVSASAKANFVTQSAISQGISKLEKSLGLSLVAHHPKCFRLTPQGEMLFNQALDILKRAAELKGKLLQKEDENLGALDFACTYSFAVAVIPQYLKKFRNQYPQVKINFRTGKNEHIKRMLMQGTIDFGILPDEGDLEMFEKLDIYSGHLRLYASKDVCVKNPESLGFILAEPVCKERILLDDSYSKKYGKEPLGILEVGSWEVMTNLVAEGMGIAYLPDYIMRRRENCLQEVDLGLELHSYNISAFYPAGMELRKSSKIFLSYFS